MKKINIDANYVLRNLSLKYTTIVLAGRYIDFVDPNNTNYMGYLDPNLNLIGLLTQYSEALPKYEQNS